MMSPSTRRRLSVVLALSPASVTLTLFLLLFYIGFLRSRLLLRGRGSDCRTLLGAEDIVMILKTGATELQDKLLVHFDSTLRCYPNSLVVSDHAETVNGRIILDVLDSVDATIRDTHPDFELYRRLREGGRTALSPSELSGNHSSFVGESIRGQIPAWKLDKWKFLPMVSRTLHEYPDKNWYFFHEADSFVFWPGLLTFLSAFDHRKPYYIGAMWPSPENTNFGHGGSGYALSRPAMKMVVEIYEEDTKRWEKLTDQQVIGGDLTLANALREAGCLLTDAWPVLQGSNNFDFNYDERAGWCSPAVSYHHMDPSAISSMWALQQRWLDKRPNADVVLRHRDVFWEYILPNLPCGGHMWEDESTTHHENTESIEDCRAICESEPDCLRYTRILDTGICHTTAKFTVGREDDTADSGWMESLQEKYSKAKPCWQPA